MANVDLKEIAIVRLGYATGVDLNDADTSETLYTVPTGKVCVPDHVRIRTLSADAGSTTCTIGKTGALTDFLNTQTLSGLNAAGAAGKLMPVPAATTVKSVEYVAGESIKIDVVAAAGAACTATVELWGYLYDA